MANLIETIAHQGNLKTLLNAVEATELKEILEGEGPLTILAPTDDAFAKLPKATFDELLSDSSKLKRILMYHILFADARSDDLAEIDEAPTAEGSVLAINHTSAGLMINDAKAIQLDILADNGVIHLIDALLIPALLAGHS